MQANSMDDEIARLEREIAKLDASRQRPHVTSISSGVSSRGKPEREPKTPWQIEMESQLEDLRQVRKSQGFATAEKEGDPDFEDVRQKEPIAVKAEIAASEQTDSFRAEDAAPPPDPLEQARDRGVRLDDLLYFIWPGTGDLYLSVSLGWLLRIASTQVGEQRILRPLHVFDAFLHEQTGHPFPTGMTLSNYLSRMRDFLRDVGGASDTKLGQFEFPSDDIITASIASVTVGPELVAILLRASALRERTNKTYRDAGIRHFLAALMLEEIGRVAIDSAGLARRGFPVFRDSLARMIEGDAPFYDSHGDDPKSWLPIVEEMRSVTLPRPSAGETHAFANDRTEADLLNTSQDASALADLLLLNDLKPPVAVGVFGPWGSGKSTLIDLLQKQIADRTAGKTDDRKVVQVKFDAWSHADAENLWASLTAELFDQLADAIDGREPDGKLRTGLITEIAKRLHKDAEAAPLAADAIEQQREAVQQAETKLASLEHEPVAAAVAGEMAKDLIAKATPKLLGGTDKKDPNKRREAEKAEQNRKHLDELLQSCGLPKDERDPEKLASVLSGLFDLPGRAALLFVLLRRSVGRGVIYGLGAALAVLIIGVAGMVWQLGWGGLPQVWTYAVSSLPSLAVLGTLVGAVGVGIRTIAPVLRLAAEFLSRKEKRAAELNKERREAAESVKKEREKLETMVAEQKKATEFAATYSVAAEGRSREGLLRYFIAFSPELAEVRKKLGLLATIRRCFETLEQIMREKHGEAPADAKSAAGNDPAGARPATAAAADLAHVPDVRRIIVYIDDLDRCSEQHVVQVLQAIHLLLAFDLFVVVVAVDARWLHRAVGKVYSGQLAAPSQVADSDQPAQTAGATVADYLEKIFQLPIWMQSIGSPETVKNFVGGIDKPEEKPQDHAQQNHAGQNGQQGTGTIAPIDTKADPTLLQTAAQRRATMSGPERQALAAMALLAGKSPRGLKRLVNTYRLIRVMRGPAGITDLVAGAAGKTSPLYPYLLFALACEVGLTTETAALVADMAARKPPSEGFHPLLDCLFADENLDDAQVQLRKCLDADGMRVALLTAVRAAYVAAAGDDPLKKRPTGTGSDTADGEPQRDDPAFAGHRAGSERFAEAFAVAARFTFRPHSR
jgi:KAP-like P-loop domain-containing protein